KMVEQHDYLKFYEYELAGRKEFFYPPFSRIVLITLKHKNKELVDAAANQLGSLLRQDLKDYVEGPAAPVVPRLRNQYLMRLLLKLPKEPGMGLTYKKVIQNHINLLLAEKQYRAVDVIPDVDPS